MSDRCQDGVVGNSNQFFTQGASLSNTGFQRREVQGTFWFGSNSPSCYVSKEMASDPNTTNTTSFQ